jgi:hypothetical protein
MPENGFNRIQASIKYYDTMLKKGKKAPVAFI